MKFKDLFKQMRVSNMLLHRMVLLIVLAILLVSLIAGVIYTQQSKSVYATMRSRELQSSLIALNGRYTQQKKGKINNKIFRDEMQTMANSTESQVFVVDKDFQNVEYAMYKIPEDLEDVEGMTPPDPLTLEEEQKVLELVVANTKNMVENSINEVAEFQRLPGTGKDFLVVGRSVFRTADKDDKDVLYTILLVKPASSITNSLNLLNRTLLVTFMMVLVAVMIPVYFASRRLMAPLSTMRDVALAMSQGDFDLRANEQQPGEIGQLSRTLNYLAGTLSQTISELKVERNRLRRILDGLAEGIIATDADLMITHVNPSICELLQIELPDNPTTLCNDIIPKEILDDFQRVVENSCTVVRSYKWDSMVLRISIAPLTNDFGYTVGAVALFHDITESERLEQTRREFVANVSHELRTPLSALRGLAEVLNDDMLKTEEDKHRYYGYILREALRLNRLVDDLLELSRLQTGSVSMRKIEFDIPETLREIHDKYSVTAEDMDIKLNMDVAEGCPRAFGNMDRVEQVCVILLDNALKYTPESGDITLGASWDDDSIYISVQDTGTGIPEEDRENVFDRFYKVDKSHSGNGTGLGLSIAKELMTMLGERIWIDNSYDGGAKFVFTVSRADNAVPNEDPPGDPSGDSISDK